MLKKEMVKGRFVVKQVPATTNNHNTAIINFLLSKGHSASRVNVMGTYDNVRHVWKTTGARKGFLDIHACIKDKNGIGRSVHIDTKTGRDKLSDDQKDFISEILSAGGIVFISKDYEKDFLPWYSKLEKDIIL